MRKNVPPDWKIHQLTTTNKRWLKNRMHMFFLCYKNVCLQKSDTYETDLNWLCRRYLIQLIKMVWASLMPKKTPSCRVSIAYKLILETIFTLSNPSDTESCHIKLFTFHIFCIKKYDERYTFVHIHLFYIERLKIFLERKQQQTTTTKAIMVKNWFLCSLLLLLLSQKQALCACLI